MMASHSKTLVKHHFFGCTITFGVFLEQKLVLWRVYQKECQNELLAFCIT